MDSQFFTILIGTEYSDNHTQTRGYSTNTKGLRPSLYRILNSDNTTFTKEGVNNIISEYESKVLDVKPADSSPLSPIFSKGRLYSTFTTINTPKSYTSDLGQSNPFTKVYEIINPSNESDYSTYKGLSIDNNQLQDIESRSLNNHPFFVIDLETAPCPEGYQIPYAIGVTYFNKSTIQDNKVFLLSNNDQDTLIETLKEIFKYIDKVLPSKKHPAYVFAHNGGSFDFKILNIAIAKIMAGHLSRVSLVTNEDQEFYQIKINYRIKPGSNRMIIMRDSIKLLNARAELSCKAFSVEKLSKLEFNHNIAQNHPNIWSDLGTRAWNETYKAIMPIHQEYDSPLSYLKEYVLRDCRMVGLALIGLRTTLNSRLNLNIPLKKIITISGLALSIFLEKFYKLPIMITGKNFEFTKDIKKSYIGGRCEVFNSGLGFDNVYHFDVPGMYARVMSSTDLPYGNPLYVGKPKSSFDSKDYINRLHESKYIGFFNCTVVCDESMKYPVLPIKEHGGKLLFPVGTFEGWFTSYELSKALEYSEYNITINSGYIFKTGPVLQDYSTTFTHIKDEAGKSKDMAKRNMAKLILNRLYGKFAASYHGNVTKLVDETGLRHHAETFDIKNSTDLGNNLYIIRYDANPKARSRPFNARFDKMKKGYNVTIENAAVNIALSSAISSKARVLLYTLIEEVQNMGGELCYTDTDSIFAWFPENPENKPFGPFIWEKDFKRTLKRALFMAPKMYILETLSGDIIKKIKGVNLKNRDDITFELLQHLFINKAILKINNVTQFKSIKIDGEYKGIKITDGLSKAYDIFKSVKREWYRVDGKYLTKALPLSFNRNEVESALKLQGEVKAKVMSEFLSKASTSSNLVPVSGSRYSYRETFHLDVTVNTIHNTLSGKVPLEDVMVGDYKRDVILYMIGCIINNTDILRASHKLISTSLLLSDDRGQYKTVRVFISSDWMSINVEEFLSILSIKVETLSERYRDDFVPINFVFKLKFDSIPSIISASGNNLSDLLTKSGYRAITKLGSKHKLESDLKSAKLAIDKYDIISPGLNKLDEILAKMYNEGVMPWMDKVSQVLIESSMVLCGVAPLGRNMSKGLINILIDNFKTELATSTFTTFESGVEIGDLDEFHKQVGAGELEVKDLKGLSKLLVEIMVRDGGLDKFNVCEAVIKSLECEDHKYGRMFIEAEVVKILKVLCDSQILIATDHRYNTRTGSRRSKRIYVINPKHELAYSWFNWSVLSKRIRLTPGSATLADARGSKYELEVLNKLSSTPIRLNKPYAVIIRDFMTKYLDGSNDGELSTKMGWLDKSQLLSGKYQMVANRKILDIVIILLEICGTDVFYFKYMTDFRGRKYPVFPHFSHIGSKYMQPLFLLGDRSYVRLGEIDILISNKDVWARTRLCSELSSLFEIKSYSNTLELVKLMTKYVDSSSEVHWGLVARVVELTHLIKYPKDSIPLSPVKYDAKCNAYQHLSRIVGDKEVMGMVNVLDSDNKIDIYQAVAKKTIDLLSVGIKSNDLPSEVRITYQYVVAALWGRKSDMRSIVKKAVMTKPYGVTFKRAKDYIVEGLNAVGLSDFNYKHVNLLRKTVWDSIKELTYKEGLYMKKMIRMLSTYSGPLKWDMMPIRDFVINIEYKKQIELTRDVTKTAFKFEVGDYDMVAARRAITANIVHRLDALNCRMVIKTFSKSLLTVHDAFLIDPFRTSAELQLCMWQAFSKIHGGLDMGGKVHDQIAKQTGCDEMWLEFLAKNGLNKVSMRYSNLLNVDAL